VSGLVLPLPFLIASLRTAVELTLAIVPVLRS
jgi:hypothetical protein